MPETTVCSAHLTCMVDAPADRTYWHDLLSTVLADLARRVANVEGALIGHLKAVSRGAGAFARANCVSSKIHPDVEVLLDAPCSRLELDLAVIVYGVSGATLHDIVQSAAAALSTSRRCQIDVRRPEQPQHRLDYEGARA